MQDGPPTEALRPREEGSQRPRSSTAFRPQADILAEPATDDTEPALDEVRTALASETDKLPIRWPHEAPKRRRRGLHVPRRTHFLDFPLGRSEAAHARLNGEEARLLGDKYKFVNLVREMGYTAPRQTLITRGQSVDERIAQVIEDFSNPEQPVICKPTDGRGGMGIIEMSASELPAFLSSLSRDYIIQERVPKKGEIRYVRQIDERDGVIRRIYDEKAIPKIVGDGKKTKGQLIREGKVPWYSKLLTQGTNLGSLGDVISEGSAVHLSFFGVPHKEETELEWKDQKQQRVKNMDLFMERFLKDLEDAVGTQLPQLAFDIGVIDPLALDEQYDFDNQEDFDKFKANLVFFECQMPFSLWGYVQRSSDNLRHMVQTARTMYGPMVTGKKSDFLTRTQEDRTTSPGKSEELE